MDVPRVDYEKLASDRTGEASEAVRQRVQCARERQLARFDGSGLSCNADTPALHRRRARAVHVWVQPISVSIVSWTRPARP